MEQEIDLIDLEGGTPELVRRECTRSSEEQEVLDLLEASLGEEGVTETRQRGDPRRLLTKLSPRGPPPPQDDGRKLANLGNDSNFHDAILGNLLSAEVGDPSPGPSSLSDDRVLLTPTAPEHPEENSTEDRTSVSSSSTEYLSYSSDGETRMDDTTYLTASPRLPPTPVRGWHVRSSSYSGGGRGGGGEAVRGGVSTGRAGEMKRSATSVELRGGNNGGGGGGTEGPAWLRASMRRVRHFRLRDPSPPPSSPPPDDPLPPDLPPLPTIILTPTAPPQTPVPENTQPECDMAGDGECQSPLGQWPHSLSFMLASLACTLGLFNISRFAILSVQFGANFILQFLIMSFVMGIPLFTFHVSLGQLLAAGTMDMWRISPVFQGIGIAILVSQALIGIYSIVGVSWMFVYFRDSFITKQDVYRWAEPYDGVIIAPTWAYNTTIKLEETVADYFSGIVLQRHHLESPANTPGRLKFQVAFNLAVVWMIVFICLSKGLKSYGKVVYLFSLVPVFGMLVLCSKLLGLMPIDTKFQSVFQQNDWSEFFLNTKSWAAAVTESFFTWGLLGASAMQIASHNRPKHFLHRDTTLITILTLTILLLAAFLAYICCQLLLANGYIYIPSSFERMSTYGFLYPSKSSLPSSFASTPVRWMPHASFLAGERVLKPGVNTRQQSGYQVLRLATELVPATLAVIGAERLSPFWSVLFYFILILFGIAQQLAIMHCVITGIMAIKVEIMKNWETTITFFTCCCGFVLGLPMATELGIFVVYFLDYCVGGVWWIILLYLIELGAVFMVRGRPYSGETIVATLFTRAGNCLLNWAAPMLSFTWNVILPVILMVLCITIFKNGNFRDLYRWSAPMSYDYWPSWSREIGSLIQLVPLLTIPLASIIQSCRYLSEGPPDILDRMQLLYRPPLESSPTIPEVTTQTDETSSTAAPSLATIEDPPPKYTPPPSYTTATGARIAKLLRQSFRRSVRRIATVLGTGGDAVVPTAPSLPPPPDYAAVLVEINQSLNSQRTDHIALPIDSPSRRNNNDGETVVATSSNLSANEVAHILRNSFRRAMRENIVESSSSQRLVDAAAPINHDSVIIDQVELDKSAESVH